jgi:hypothetical protein
MHASAESVAGPAGRRMHFSMYMHAACTPIRMRNANARGPRKYVATQGPQRLPTVAPMTSPRDQPHPALVKVVDRPIATANE